MPASAPTVSTVSVVQVFRSSLFVKWVTWALFFFCGDGVGGLGGRRYIHARIMCAGDCVSVVRRVGPAFVGGGVLSGVWEAGI